MTMKHTTTAVKPLAKENAGGRTHSAYKLTVNCWVSVILVLLAFLVVVLSPVSTGATGTAGSDESFPIAVTGIEP